jgi:ABC-type branched-subunit amino acid transport system substrate-binding protein
MYGPKPRPDSANWTTLSQRYKEETDRELDISLSYYVANEYDACWLYAKAIINAETTETEAIKMILYEIADNHYGVSGPIFLNDNGDRHLVDYDIWGCGSSEWIKYGEYVEGTGVYWFPP